MLNQCEAVSSNGTYVSSDQSFSNKRDITKPTVSQELLSEIMAVGKYSLKYISAQIHIPLITLRRIKSGKTLNPRSSAFEKILGFYCRVCQ